MASASTREVMPSSSGPRAPAAAAEGEILVSFLNSGDDPEPGLVPVMMTFAGKLFDLSALPKNRHGDAEFVVKVQNAMDPDTPLAIYDEPKSFWIPLSGNKHPAEHAALMAALMATPPPPGSLGPWDPRRKIYLFARREGPSLRIIVDGRRPRQKQPW